MWYSPKKKSPLPPTSANYDNLNSNKQTEFVGDIIIKGTDLHYSFGGPRFDSTSSLNDVRLPFYSENATLIQQSYKIKASFYALVSLLEKYESLNGD